MINFFQLSFIILLILFIIFIIIYAKQKRFKDVKGLVWKSIFDAISLNSGILIILYVAGKIFSWNYFTDVDNYALYIALIIAGFIIIADAIDKIINKKEVPE